MSREQHLFAAAVQAVLDHLQADGHEILDASFESATTPHVAASGADGLLFVLVQGIEGPPLPEFSEESYFGQIVPLVDAVTWHPKGRAVANAAAGHGARPVLALVGLLDGGDDNDGEPVVLAKVFPLRDLDERGYVAPPRR
jgi:hypothetical protein